MTKVGDRSERPIVIGDGVPWFHLPTIGGGQIRSTSVRGRSNLALIVLPDLASATARTSLAGVNRRQNEFAALHATVIVVTGGLLSHASDVQAALDVDFPIAVDEPGRAIARLRRGVIDATSPLVLLTDRYLEVRVRTTGWTALSESGVTDLLEWLRYIDSLCSV